MKRRSLLLAAPACALAEPKIENESSRHWHARVAAFGWRYWGLLDRLDAVLAQRPAQVVLMIGVNDLVFAGTPFEALLPSLRTLLERLQAGGPQLLVQAVLPVRGSLAVHRARIDRYNDALATEVERLRLPWLDLRFAFTDAEGLLRAELAADAVHLNDAGYRRWAEALAPRLLR